MKREFDENNIGSAQATDRHEPQPLSFEFEVMRIFPICASLLAFVGVVMVCEFVCYHASTKERRANAKLRVKSFIARGMRRIPRIREIRDRIRHKILWKNVTNIRQAGIWSFASFDS